MEFLKKFLVLDTTNGGLLTGSKNYEVFLRLPYYLLLGPKWDRKRRRFILENPSERLQDLRFFMTCFFYFASFCVVYQFFHSVKYSTESSIFPESTLRIVHLNVSIFCVLGVYSTYCSTRDWDFLNTFTVLMQFDTTTGGKVCK